VGGFFKRHKRNSSLTNQSITNDKSSSVKKEPKNSQVILNSYKKSTTEFSTHHPLSSSTGTSSTGEMGVNSMNRQSGGFSPNNSTVTFSAAHNNSSGGGGGGDGTGTRHQPSQNPFNLCPKLDEVPLIEPLICKRVATERLTSIVFKEDGFVMATQDGFAYSWARPYRSRVSQLFFLVVHIKLFDLPFDRRM
jgi:hypothetical protein